MMSFPVWVLLCVIALPLGVAVFDLSVLTTVLFVIAVLALRWLIVMRGLASRADGPDYVLETITGSHFAEKVRWCLDKLGVPYRERRWAGTLGAFYRGRTVPVLEFRTGSVTSRIGNSPEILRYLWAAHSVAEPEAAAFLEATAERIELEQQLDRYGRDLQIWAYYHLADDREATLRAWGADDPAVPAWQRLAIKALFPVQVALIRRAFRVGDRSYSRAMTRIRDFMHEVETRLETSPRSLLPGAGPNYTDYTFAALSSVWAFPDNFAGRSEALIDVDSLREGMQRDIRELREQFPKASTFVDTLYRDERSP